MRALIMGAIVFSLAVSAPLIASLLPNSSDDDENLDVKITAVKLPPKKQEEKKPDLPPPPPPKPKVDQVKFVKPVVAKAEEVVEEIVEVKQIKDKNIGAETIKGDPDAILTVDEPVGTGTAAVVEEDNTVYNTAGIEQKPEFPGGMEKFYKFVGNNYQAPEEEGLKGKVYVTFVVEKDGSLTDIKVLRDIGYGTGKEAIRVLNKCPKWIPGEQNGKKVRVLYSLPITIQSAE
jgi:protein TonB